MLICLLAWTRSSIHGLGQVSRAVCGHVNQFHLVIAVLRNFCLSHGDVVGLRVDCGLRLLNRRDSE